MERSVYAAKLLGPTLTIVGLGMLINADAYMTLMNDMLRTPGVVFFASIVGLTAGVALALAHNVWTADWRAIITGLAWLDIVESAAWLLAPDAMTRLGFALISHSGLALLWGVVVAALGGALLYFGYFCERGRH